MKSKKPSFLIFIVPIISLIIGIATLNHYGINWDEPYHYRRGQAFLQYILTGKKDYSNLSKYPPLKGDSDNPNFRNGQENFLSVQKDQSLSDPKTRRSFYQDDSWDGNFFIDSEVSYGHPALNGVLAALFNKIFYQKLGILGDLESYRFFIILTVSITTFIIAYFMWSEFGIIESVISSLSLSIFPILLGEQHFNIKDPIEACFYTLTIIFAYLGIKNNKFKLLLISSIFFSIALATKFNVIFSIIPLSVWFLFHFKKTKIKNILFVAIITPILAILLILISYPTMWKNPIQSFMLMIKFYREAGYPGALPPNKFQIGPINIYPLTWIVYTTPPIILWLFVSGILFFKKLLKQNDFALLLILWLGATLARNSLFGALSYGGVRLIMEFVPALCMFVGISAGVIVNKFNNKKIKLTIIIIIIICFAPTIQKLILIHPNENVYFNFLVNGLKGAKEINLPSWGDSYGNAYYEGVQWLNKNAEKGAKVSTPIGNTTNIPRFKLRNDIAISPYYWSGLKHNGEYLIELTYDYPPMNYFALKYLNEAMTPVYEVKVDGVAIAKVWKNDINKIKPEFKNTGEISIKPNPDATLKTINITLPENKKIMKVTLNQPIIGCTQLKTGFVETSLDNKNWVREPEDIASNQLDREELKKLEPIYEFYFMAKNAKYIRFNIDNSSSCLLKTTLVKITFLTP